MEIISLKIGDICLEKTDAIVNAANDELTHGGGVAGAIVRAGGEIIQNESNEIAPILLGQVGVTSAGSLRTKYIIHAATMHLGELAEEENIKNSLINSFLKAKDLGVKSISFPALGAGTGGFSLDRCAEISIFYAKKYQSYFNEIVFVLYSKKAFKAFQKYLKIK
ncbi:MAG: macro domain-containing protein [Patescibacteria group bacterium]|jgi:O-acetyl-ADP-ribose deacetylase (regulator of RNase III)